MMFKKIMLLTLALALLAPVVASAAGPTPDHGHVITQPKADGG